MVNEYPHISGYQTGLAKSQRLLAGLLKKIGQTDEAQQLLRNIHPHTVKEYVQRAELFRQAREYDKALADYDKALELNPNDALAYRDRGLVYMRLKQYDKALADYDKAGEIDTKSPTLGSKLNSDYANLGELLSRMGRTAAAERAFRRGLEIADGLTTEFPENDYYWFQFIDSAGRLVTLLNSTGRHEEGKRILAEIIVPESGSRDVYVRRAGIFASFGHFEKALADFDKANELKPDHCYSRYQHALTALAVNDLPSYRRSCQQMLEQFADSKVSDELHFIAWTCVLHADGVDDYSLAIELVKRAVEAEPKLPAHQQCLGALLFRAGRFNDALEHLNEAAESQDNELLSRAYTCYFLAMTHRKLGHSAEAKQWFGKAVEWTERVLDENREYHKPVVWNRRLTLELFHKEAAQLLGIPAVAPQPQKAEENDSHTGDPGASARIVSDEKQ